MQIKQLIAPGIVALSLGMAPAVSSADPFNGGYIGLSAGYIDADTSGGASLSGESGIYGIYGGYNFGLDQAVLGGEIEWDAANANLGGAAEIESVLRLKLRAGYQLGGGLLFVTGGWAQADTDTLDDSDGYFLGLGYEYAVTDQVSIGGEYLNHQFDDYNNTGIDVQADTYKLRVAWNF